MRMACVPMRDFLCKLCRRISSDKKENCIKDKSGNFIKNLTDLTYNRNKFESDLQYLKLFIGMNLFQTCLNLLQRKYDQLVQP